MAKEGEGRGGKGREGEGEERGDSDMYCKGHTLR